MISRVLVCITIVALLLLLAVWYGTIVAVLGFVLIVLGFLTYPLVVE